MNLYYHTSSGCIITIFIIIINFGPYTFMFCLYSIINRLKVKVFDSLWPHGPYSPWNSPGQDTGVGSLSLLQGIFPTQGSKPGLPHCRLIFYQLSHKGSPRTLEWVAYPFCSRFSWPRNEAGVPCIAGGFFTSWDIRNQQITKLQILLEKEGKNLIPNIACLISPFLSFYEWKKKINLSRRTSGEKHILKHNDIFVEHS